MASKANLSTGSNKSTRTTGDDSGTTVAGGKRNRSDTIVASDRNKEKKKTKKSKKDKEGDATDSTTAPSTDNEISRDLEDVTMGEEDEGVLQNMQGLEQSIHGKKKTWDAMMSEEEEELEEEEKTLLKEGTFWAKEAEFQARFKHPTKWPNHKFMPSFPMTVLRDDKTHDWYKAMDALKQDATILIVTYGFADVLDNAMGWIERHLAWAVAEYLYEEAEVPKGQYDAVKEKFMLTPRTIETNMKGQGKPRKLYAALTVLEKQGDEIKLTSQCKTLAQALCKDKHTKVLFVRQVAYLLRPAKALTTTKTPILKYHINGVPVNLADTQEMKAAISRYFAQMSFGEPPELLTLKYHFTAYNWTAIVKFQNEKDAEKARSYATDADKKPGGNRALKAFGQVDSNFNIKVMAAEPEMCSGCKAEDHSYDNCPYTSLKELREHKKGEKA